MSDKIEKSEKLTEILNWDTTPLIADYLKTEITNYHASSISSEVFEQWMDHCKKELKIKKDVLGLQKK